MTASFFITVQQRLFLVPGASAQISGFCAVSAHSVLKPVRVLVFCGPVWGTLCGHSGRLSPGLTFLIYARACILLARMPETHPTGGLQKGHRETGDKAGKTDGLWCAGHIQTAPADGWGARC